MILAYARIAIKCLPSRVGGPGAIQEFVNSGALVISQTAEAHEEIAEYLRALREARAARIGVK